MKADQLNEWRDFCEWLNKRKGKHAYFSEVPERWKHLVYTRPVGTWMTATDLRREAGLIFHHASWGWRLRKNWRERLAELEKAIEGQS